MLNKDICQRCYFNAVGESFGNHCIFNVNWVESEVVACVAVSSKTKPIFGVWSIYKDPPEECPYVLEHLLKKC